MGNQPSRDDSGNSQLGDLGRVPTLGRASRHPSRISQRQTAGPSELEGDPNVSRFYELEGDRVYRFQELEGDQAHRFHELDGHRAQPEMALNSRSAGAFMVNATYLQPEDIRMSQHAPAELSSGPNPTTRPFNSAADEPYLTPPAGRDGVGTRDIDSASWNGRLETTQRPQVNIERSQTTPVRSGTTPRPALSQTRPQSIPARRYQSACGGDSAQVNPISTNASAVKNDPVRIAQLSRQIASVSHLLREMYSLDLKIFGTQNARSEDQAARNRMIDQADSLFERILVALSRLDAQEECWTNEERVVITSIRRTAERHSPRRSKISRV